MFLDIKGTILLKSQTPNVDVLRNEISRGLSEHKAKVSINQGGVILWQGSWLNLISFRQRLWGLEGRINFTENSQGVARIDYFLSLIVNRILCSIFSLSTILIYLLKGIELPGLLIFNLAIWFWLYGFYYFIIKLWFRGFLKRLSSCDD
jgi:hypothetical protein